MQGVTGYVSVVCWEKLFSQLISKSSRKLSKLYVEITFEYGHWIYFFNYYKTMYNSEMVQIHFFRC